ncbi:MAG TPA: hypothetical protein VFV38_11605 [Ktedonobacteraceae bacterium]|nr:hypothetical protein [Ktedonobacteraceae bacterium]
MQPAIWEPPIELSKQEEQVADRVKADRIASRLKLAAPGQQIPTNNRS